MATFNAKRGVWRLTATATRPGHPRTRRVRDFHAPNTRAGRKAAELEEMRLRVTVADALAADPLAFDLGTFGEAAVAWQARNQRRWSPYTRRTVDHALRTVILDDHPAGGRRLGELPLEAVTAKRIEAMYQRWAGRYANSTARRYHGMVRKILADAERLDETGTYRSPMSRVEAAGGKAPSRAVNMPKPADVRQVIDQSSAEMAAFFEIAAQCAARRGTILALRWRDVDLNAGLINFEHAIAIDLNGDKVRKSTKADRPYQVPIEGRALEALRAHRARARETALALGLIGRFDSLYVFTSERRGQRWGLDPWNPTSPTHAWRNTADRLGLDEVRLHDVRHLAASTMLSRGIPVPTVAMFMGCTEANVLRTYSHWIASTEVDRAAAVLREAFTG